jgi:hypothetical protein
MSEGSKVPTVPVTCSSCGKIIPPDGTWGYPIAAGAGFICSRCWWYARPKAEWRNIVTRDALQTAAETASRAHNLLEHGRLILYLW